MNQKSVVADCAAELRWCGDSGRLAEGRCVHSRMMESGLTEETYLCNLLVQMYGKCKSVKAAREVFDATPKKNVFSWTLMITAYAQNDDLRSALLLFRQMDLFGYEADEFSFLTVIGVCSKLGCLRDGIEVHKCAAFKGYDSGVLVGTAIVDMYAKFGRPQSARLVFDLVEKKDVVLWTAMIVAYSQHGHGKLALDLFRRMDLDGLKLDKYVFGGVLAACGSVRNLREGKEVHKRAVELGLESDIVLATGLCNMYAKCGSLEDSRKVFSSMTSKDLVAWNSMIAASAQSGRNSEALEIYREMIRLPSSSSVTPDDCTYVTVLGACSALKTVEEVRMVHSRVAAAGLESDDALVTALVDAYSNCGSLSDATEVFLRSKKRSSHQSSLVVSWNAMMAANLQHGDNRGVLELLQKMDLEGLKASEVTFVTALSSCAFLGEVGRGKQLHDRISAAGFDIFAAPSSGRKTDSGVLATALVNMYAKCGRLDEARELFLRMDWRDTVAWNAMIAAYAQFGGDIEAVKLFLEMNLEGGFADESTLVSVLQACSHSGRVAQARQYFCCMEQDFGIVRSAEHSACVIDGLGRAGRLDDAEELAKSLMHADSVAWTAVLGACKTQGSFRRAKQAAKQVVELGPVLAATAYVLVATTSDDHES